MPGRTRAAAKAAAAPRSQTAKESRSRQPPVDPFSPSKDLSRLTLSSPNGKRPTNGMPDVNESPHKSPKKESCYQVISVRDTRKHLHFGASSSESSKENLITALQEMDELVDKEDASIQPQLPDLPSPNEFKSPAKDRLRSPVKSPLESPLKSPAKSPIKSPSKCRLKPPAKLPFKSPAKSPLMSPVKTEPVTVGADDVCVVVPKTEEQAASPTLQAASPRVQVIRVKAGQGKRPPKGKKKEPKPEATKPITAYFPEISQAARRSVRKTSTQLQWEEEQSLLYKVLTGCEEGLEIVNFEDKGRGVVATRVFEKGQFVVEYSGDLITYSSACDREEEYGLDPTLGCYMYFFEHNKQRYCIDATAETGKLGRLLNHCRKQPNCRTRVLEVDDSPRLYLETVKTVVKGEELTYDYGDRSKVSLDAHPWLAL